MNGTFKKSRHFKAKIANNISSLCNSILLVGVTTMMSHSLYAKEIIINVEKINTKKQGNIVVMLYGKDGFPKDHTKAIASQVIPATTASMQVKFDLVPEEFAIKVHHDEDESGEVTKNWTGFIPAEGLGFSNGAKLNFGPPNFKKAKLNLSKVSGPLKLDMIYP